MLPLPWYQAGAVPWGGGAKAPVKISKKGKIKKKYGVFSCIKIIQIRFSVIIFNEEICALEGLLSSFWH